MTYMVNHKVKSTKESIELLSESPISVLDIVGACEINKILN